jgi:hypothetical protein
VHRARIKKAKKENDKARAAELKEQHFSELKSEMRKQTNTQERLVHLYELRSYIKTAMMTKNKKLLKYANDEMAKMAHIDSSPTDDDDDNDDDVPPTIPRAEV